MELEDLIQIMKNPETYDHELNSVDIIQTPLHVVFLTGKYVYKI